MSKAIRTRFAPSPTGHLHIGSVRTALYAWLFAKKNQGEFILRIEDTDLERSKPEYTQGILDSLRWLGLDWDSGPFFQTERSSLYQSMAHQLYEGGHAYYCSCSPERLEQLRTTQMAHQAKPQYDGHCRDQGNGPQSDQKQVLRFRTPQTGEILIQDVVYGNIVIQNKELDDWILLRSDGSPTYNFTVVVDDWDMQISHVIRGDDHISNTPKQIHVLRALGAEVPVYAHIPMILGPDGQKLSKRHGAQDTMTYRLQGYLPAALLNYLVRLGWSFGDQEIFSLEEMIEQFDLKDIHRSPSALNFEKLKWVNQQYFKTTDYSAVESQLLDLVSHLRLNASDDFDWQGVLPLLWEYQRESSQTLVELLNKGHFIWEKPDPQVLTLEPEQRLVLKQFVQVLKAIEIERWEPATLKLKTADFLQDNGLKMPVLGMPLRLVLTGSPRSPSAEVILCLIGKERVLERLESVLK